VARFSKTLQEIDKRIGVFERKSEEIIVLIQGMKQFSEEYKLLQLQQVEEAEIAFLRTISDIEEAKGEKKSIEDAIKERDKKWNELIAKIHAFLVILPGAPKEWWEEMKKVRDEKQGQKQKDEKEERLNVAVWVKEAHESIERSRRERKESRENVENIIAVFLNPQEKWDAKEKEKREGQLEDSIIRFQRKSDEESMNIMSLRAKIPVILAKIQEGGEKKQEIIDRAAEYREKVQDLEKWKSWKEKIEEYIEKLEDVEEEIEELKERIGTLKLKMERLKKSRKKKQKRAEELKEVHKNLKENEKILREKRREEEKWTAEMLEGERKYLPELFILYPDLEAKELKEMGGMEKKRSIGEYQNLAPIEGLTLSLFSMSKIPI